MVRETKTMSNRVHLWVEISYSVDTPMDNSLSVYKSFTNSLQKVH